MEAECSKVNRYASIVSVDMLYTNQLQLLYYLASFINLNAWMQSTIVFIYKKKLTFDFFSSKKKVTKDHASFDAFFAANNIFYCYWHS